MRFLFTVFALLSALSFILAVPIQERQDLERRTVTHPTHHAGSSKHASSSHHGGAKASLIGKTKPAGKLALKVKMMGGAKAVLAKSGLTSKDFGGKDPQQWHLDHVKNHIKGDPKMKHVVNAAISAPVHKGGLGGGKHKPDMSNHVTVKVNNKGKGQTTIHVPAPGAPSVDNKHFGHP